MPSMTGGIAGGDDARAMVKVKLLEANSLSSQVEL